MSRAASPMKRRVLVVTVTPCASAERTRLATVAREASGSSACRQCTPASPRWNPDSCSTPCAAWYFAPDATATMPASRL